MGLNEYLEGKRPVDRRNVDFIKSWMNVQCAVEANRAESLANNVSSFNAARILHGQAHKI